VDSVFYPLYGADGFFREIELLGLNVSPFLVGYLLLLGYLIATGRRSRRQPAAAWFVSIIVIATLLLWAPLRPQQLLWLTPMLIALGGQDRKVAWSWLLLQLAFVVMLLNQEAALNIALPRKLSAVFDLPNLPAALAIQEPALYRLYSALLGIADIVLVLALLLAIWISVKGLVTPATMARLKPAKKWWLFLPAAVLFLGLAVTLLLARDLVDLTGENVWRKVAAVSGSAVDPLSLPDAAVLRDTLDLSTLSRFDAGQALRELIVDNILGDFRLLLAMGLALALALLFAGVLAYRYEMSAGD
jgi:hypothetical protein